MKISCYMHCNDDWSREFVIKGTVGNGLHTYFDGRKSPILYTIFRNLELRYEYGYADPSILGRRVDGPLGSNSWIPASVAIPNYADKQVPDWHDILFRRGLLGLRNTGIPLTPRKDDNKHTIDVWISQDLESDEKIRGISDQDRADITKFIADLRNEIKRAVSKKILKEIPLD